MRASAHLARDFALTEQGDLVTGAESRIAALRGFEEVGDRWGLVMSLLPIGSDHSLRGEYAQAIATFERTVALSSGLGTEDYLYLSKAGLAREPPQRRPGGSLPRSARRAPAGPQAGAAASGGQHPRGPGERAPQGR
ncbi:hypothetical protein ACFWV1_02745 [Streptomyces sp. NPDC058700]|uniref:hypothetical protein n=1 Tax=Streptomyces sp. NPDC058700 TaxID=3346607 RepID=UPI00365F3AE1